MRETNLWNFARFQPTNFLNANFAQNTLFSIFSLNKSIPQFFLLFLKKP